MNDMPSGCTFLVRLGSCLMSQDWWVSFPVVARYGFSGFYLSFLVSKVRGGSQPKSPLKGCYTPPFIVRGVSRVLSTYKESLKNEK